MDYDNLVGYVNEDGSTFCWFCLIDEVYLNSYNPAEVVPETYSNQQFYEHITSYHKVCRCGPDYDWDYGRYKAFMQKDDHPNIERYYKEKGFVPGNSIRQRQGAGRLFRIGLGNEFAKCWALFSFETVIHKAIEEEGDLLHHGYKIGYNNDNDNDSEEVKCYLCDIDNTYFDHLSDNEKVLLHSNNKEGFKKSRYTEYDFAKHLLDYHRVNREMWNKYIPYLQHVEEPSYSDMQKISASRLVEVMKPKESDWIAYTQLDVDWDAFVKNVPNYDKYLQDMTSLTSDLREEMHKERRRRNELVKEKQKRYSKGMKSFKKDINRLVSILYKYGKAPAQDRSMKGVCKLVVDELEDSLPGLSENIIYECLSEHNKIYYGDKKEP